MHVAGYVDELIEEVVKLYSAQSLNDTAEKERNRVCKSVYNTKVSRQNEHSGKPYVTLR